MMILLGVVVVMALVFGGYNLSGGSMAPIWHSLPYEMTMVGGASIGAFMISNSFTVIKMTGSAIKRAMTGTKWKRKDYSDLLSLMYELSREYQINGALGIEEHITEPGDSDIFQKYPKILNDHEISDLIVDAFRMVTMEFDDPMHTEETMEKKIAAHHEHMMQPIKSLNSVADALPAIGIVAAVLGVIKTMAAVDQPPEVLGGMIGGALVGTFLGVFLAYCFVQPFAFRVKQIDSQDAAFANVIKDVIVSILHQYNASLCIEIGRGNIPPDMRPSFLETEETQKKLKSERPTQST